MEALSSLALEWSRECWSHCLLTCRTWHRTNVIKAELTRRKSVESSRDRNKATSSGQSRALGSTQDRVESHTERPDTIIVDVSEDTIASSSSNSVCNYSDEMEMQRVFDLFDENKDGLISAEELQPFMRKLGFELAEQRVTDMIRTVDKNGDGSVDFREFLSLYSFLCGEEAPRRTGGNDNGQCGYCPTSVREDHAEDEETTLLKAFFVFDENKDGLISALELQQVLLKLGLSEGRSLIGCQKMINKVDSDGNGQVDFFEFKDMMCSDAFNFCRP